MMNVQPLPIAPFEALPLSADHIADLRSDHAGETGAVAIYRGVLAVSREPSVRRFALRHLRAELLHRRFFDRWLPERHQSRLLPLWRAAGGMLGAVAGLFGPRGVYRMVAAVETFVERHYEAQIAKLAPIPALAPLAAQLQTFRDDETHHQVDAARRLADSPGWVARAWFRTVGAGSALGVRIARRL